MIPEGGIGAVRWRGGPDGALELIDQTRLPLETEVLTLRTLEGVRDAICRLAVRGAPAIGVAAAFGLWLGIRDAPEDDVGFEEALARAAQRLESARPTAANLAWAVRRVAAAARAAPGAKERKAAAFRAALAILEEDAATCRALGEQGVDLLRGRGRVMTHCNTGGLAAAGSGTALALVFEAARRGLPVSVVACETRPLLQGARLTMWELMRAGVDATLVCDNAAASVMAEGKVDCVLVGADRIARNGDTANKIGTYSLAIVASAHGIPLYVVAPRSTFDLSIADGSEIPIEQRSPEEVTQIGGVRIAPPRARVHAPAFDVTPARLIAGIVTEAGVIAPVGEAAIAAAFAGAKARGAS
jgi:methylthioribose-1-phosphate isomerase